MDPREVGKMRNLHQSLGKALKICAIFGTVISRSPQKANPTTVVQNRTYLDKKIL